MGERTGRNVARDRVSSNASVHFQMSTMVGVVQGPKPGIQSRFPT